MHTARVFLPLPVLCRCFQSPLLPVPRNSVTEMVTVYSSSLEK